MSACMDCGKNLTYNEIGAYKKICEPGKQVIPLQAVSGTEAGCDHRRYRQENRTV